MLRLRPLFRTLFRILFTALSLLAVTGWLLHRDEISDPGVTAHLSPRQSLRETCVIDVDWSARGDSLLCLIRGELNGKSPVWLHTPDESTSARPVELDAEQILKIALLPDASAAVIVGEAGNVQRIDLASDARTRLYRIPTGTSISDLAVSPDSRVLAIAMESDIILCDSSRGEELARFSTPPVIVIRVSFSSDGRFLIAGRIDGTLCLWNLETLALERVVPAHEGPVSMARFIADNGTVASIGQADDKLCITSIATGARQWQASADQQGLLALAVSPDGHLAATGGFNRSIELWDLEKRGRLRTLVGHTGAIRALQFTADGTQLTSAGDGTICLWDVETATVIWAVDVQHALH